MFFSSTNPYLKRISVICPFFPRPNSKCLFNLKVGIMWKEVSWKYHVGEGGFWHTFSSIQIEWFIILKHRWCSMNTFHVLIQTKEYLIFHFECTLCHAIWIYANSNKKNNVHFQPVELITRSMKSFWVWEQSFFFGLFQN